MREAADFPGNAVLMKNATLALIMTAIKINKTNHLRLKEKNRGNGAAAHLGNYYIVRSGAGINLPG
jgi:hypothetical protein